MGADSCLPIRRHDPEPEKLRAPGAERAYASNGISFDLKPGKSGLRASVNPTRASRCARHARWDCCPTVSPLTPARSRSGLWIAGADEDGWRDLRGRRIAMVFQEPMTALNPLMRIATR